MNRLRNSIAGIAIAALLPLVAVAVACGESAVEQHPQIAPEPASPQDDQPAVGSTQAEPTEAAQEPEDSTTQESRAQPNAESQPEPQQGRRGRDRTGSDCTGRP